MKPITKEDYLDFIREHGAVSIENSEIEIGSRHEIEKYQPGEFSLETTTVWSFPSRGRWATHRGDYRGNWPPQLVRNLLIRYSRPGEWVLDQMCGGGTTLIECKLLGRNAIGVDINYEALMLTLDRLNFAYRPEGLGEPEIRVYQGDARNLNLVEDESIDLVATHPPYADIIPYSRGRAKGDLSRSSSLEKYLRAMRDIAAESFRVLRPGRFCAILVGDTRRRRHYIPIAFRVMQQFLDAGFILREDVIKCQWRMRRSREKWMGLVRAAEGCWVERPRGRRYWTDFLLISHEHLFIFRKPQEGEDTSRYALSMRWW
ncbi:MAG: hypothetical protein AYL28_003100 [Candidatus Bathyarchaeota archaeon B23]|nr:MAG: hypothetical protein AYL28_003100 [Candidatus Bathyarchaeota archaeon B23]